jgi:hypothetical protein
VASRSRTRECQLEERLAWKRSVVGHNKQELKGQDLTANQMYSFSHKVLPLTVRDTHLTFWRRYEPD